MNQLKSILLSLLFLSLNTSVFAQKDSSKYISKSSFGGTIEYTYQNANVCSVGPNFCIGSIKGKSQVTNFYSYEILYSAILKNGDFQNGFKTGFSYNRTNDNGIGINTSIHLLKYKNNDIIIPNIGISYLGFIVLGYGRAIPLNNNLKSTHQIGIKLFLNKSLGLIFKMV